MVKKLVYIYSGIPGSGKSTEVEKRRAREGGRVVSADHYFIQDDGSYQFDPREIGNAHAVCFRNFIACLEDGVPIIHVDNTNIEAYEIAPYIQAANAYEYAHLIVPIICDVRTAYERQTHGVPWATCTRMAARFTMRDLPPFWAMGPPVFTSE